jgi:hypothetical protein
MNLRIGRLALESVMLCFNSLRERIILERSTITQKRQSKAAKMIRRLKNSMMKLKSCMMNFLKNRKSNSRRKNQKKLNKRKQKVLSS